MRRLTERTFQSLSLLAFSLCVACTVAWVVTGSGPYPFFRSLQLDVDPERNDATAAFLTFLATLLPGLALILLLHRHADVPPLRGKRDAPAPLTFGQRPQARDDAARDTERFAINFGLAAGGGVAGASVLAGWYPDWFGDEATLQQALCFAVPLAILAGIRQGRTWSARILYTVAFCVVSVGCLPTTSIYLTMRPDPVLTAEFLLPVMIGGLPGGLLVLLVHRWTRREKYPGRWDTPPPR
ncbi:hypothetical protein [Chondromyces apiculatus]|uniref:Uncharacterized protein n=1 Tax=Chondromyces apiculatus DSM 436 TaxID=1192034 RepID=A0A017SZR3_9BACT|nr:hypothetical protein [Chondromyces apiculatus]EYF02463.1 Hypothetical protein CAP_7085 [Chondromyces apiculatus DSM 436]